MVVGRREATAARDATVAQRVFFLNHGLSSFSLPILRESERERESGEVWEFRRRRRGSTKRDRERERVERVV